MTRIAATYPTISLATTFATRPPPWVITKRWPMRIAGCDGAEIRDAAGKHVLDCEATLAEAIIAAVHAAFVLAPAVTLEGPAEPWRGQESLEAPPEVQPCE